MMHSEYGLAEPEDKEAIEPCCMLYKEFYLQDHEHGCPALYRALEDRR